jgi:tellurite resistance protein
MIIETRAGAFAAVATLVVGADRMATEEERGFIFGRMTALPAFENLDDGAFMQLLADTTEEVCTSFPCADGRVTDEGVSQVLDVVKGILTPEQKQEAFRMAVDLARADGMVADERSLLNQLRDGLGIDEDTAQELLGKSRVN